MLSRLQKTSAPMIFLPGLSEEEIAAEWDRNVEFRGHELENHLDQTFDHIICPTFAQLLEKYAHGVKGIDIGCGLGYLTNFIANLGFAMLGIDISAKSIAYATSRFPSIQFLLSSIVDYALLHREEFDVCTANMVLHNVIDLQSNLRAVYSMLRKGGVFIASLPHPCYWPQRRNLEVNYTEENWYKVPFRIRGGKVHPSPITYVHRPIGTYLRSLKRANLEIVDFIEPGLPGESCTDIVFIVCKKS